MNATNSAEPLRILVCINKRLGPAKPSCDGRALADAIEAEVRARGLAIPVERFVCFGACHEGPNVRLAPGGRFFHRVSAADVPAIVDAALSARRCE
jgi:(2Fe-2S) ferredoxin